MTMTGARSPDAGANTVAGIVPTQVRVTVSPAVADSRCQRPTAMATSAATATPRSTRETPPSARQRPRPRYAACFSSSSDQIAASDSMRWSMSASVCSGEGVTRSRSVPRGTVG